MKAIVQEKYGSSEVLELRDIDKPEIGDSDVLIRVRAAAVNPADWAIGHTGHRSNVPAERDPSGDRSRRRGSRSREGRHQRVRRNS
jgi:NADPH:quinone reductase-like Zn-dependent oxidoreductase